MVDNDIIRIRSVVDLMKSIVINVNEVADFYNIQHSYYNGIDISDDKTTWQYYLNMAGLKHETNNDIKMISLDTSEEIILSQETLEIHTITKQELLLYEDVFDYVNKDNGGQEGYLRGLLNPIPLEISTNAENFEVLFLDERYYSERESTLRTNIKYALNAFVKRWYVPEYEFENRYVPTIYAQLLSVASLEILNTRLSSLHTSRASDLDIKEHMNSNIHTSDILRFIDEDVKIWLYMNMRRIVRNVSKDSTLQELLINVLKPSGLSLHDIVYETPQVIMNQNTSDVTAVPWTNRASLILENRDPDVVEEIVSHITEKEYLTLQANTTNLDYNSIMIESIKSSRKTFDYPNTMKTKSIYLSKNTTAETIELESTVIILENWIHDVYRGIEHSSRIVNVGNLGDIRISSQIAIRFILAILFKEMKVDSKITGFRTENVIVDTNFDSVVTFKTTRDVNVESELVNIIPAKDTSYSSDTYHDYMKDVFNFNVNLWILKSSIKEETNITNLKMLERHMYGVNNDKSSLFDINNTGTVDFEKELTSLGYNIEFDKPYDVIDEIMSKFTGYTFRTDGSMMLDVFKGFLDKLLSYNVQLLQSLETTKILRYKRSTNLIRGLNIGFVGFDGMLLEPIGPERLTADVKYFLDGPPEFLDTLECCATEKSIESNISFKIDALSYSGMAYEFEDIKFLQDDGHIVHSYKTYPSLRPFELKATNLPTIVDFIDDEIDNITPRICRVKMIVGDGNLDRIVIEDNDHTVHHDRCNYSVSRTLDVKIDMSMTRDENSLILNMHSHRNVLKHGNHIEDVYFDRYFVDTFLSRNTTIGMSSSSKDIIFEDGHSVAETLVNDSQYNMDMLTDKKTWNNVDTSIDLNDDIEVYITDYPTTLTGTFVTRDDDVFFMEDTLMISSTLPTGVPVRDYGIQNIMTLNTIDVEVTDSDNNDDMLVTNIELNSTLLPLDMDEVLFDEDGGIYEK